MKTNIIAFKKLIKRYESITLEEIKKAFKDPEFEPIQDLVKETLTGFGSRLTCSLCQGICYNTCSPCIYSQLFDTEGSVYYCLREMNNRTYSQIENADTMVDLQNAYKARAEHMRSILDELGYKQPK